MHWRVCGELSTKDVLVPTTGSFPEGQLSDESRVIRVFYLPNEESRHTPGPSDVSDFAASVSFSC